MGLCEALRYPSLSSNQIGDQGAARIAESRCLVRARCNLDCLLHFLRTAFVILRFWMCGGIEWGLWGVMTGGCGVGVGVNVGVGVTVYMGVSVCVGVDVGVGVGVGMGVDVSVGVGVGVGVGAGAGAGVGVGVGVCMGVGVGPDVGK